jgi:hypothetical protein
MGDATRWRLSRTEVSEKQLKQESDKRSYRVLLRLAAEPALEIHDRRAPIGRSKASRDPSKMLPAASQFQDDRSTRSSHTVSG